MSLDAQCLARAKIVQLVSSLTTLHPSGNNRNNKNSSSNHAISASSPAVVNRVLAEFSSTYQRFGIDLEGFALQSLLQECHVAVGAKNPSSKPSLALQVLSQVCATFWNRSHFASAWCGALQEASIKPNSPFLTHFAQNLKLSPLSELVYLLALSRSPDQSWKEAATSRFQARLTDYVQKFESDTPLDSILEIESSPGLVQILLDLAGSRLISTEVRNQIRDGLHSLKQVSPETSGPTCELALETASSIIIESRDLMMSSGGPSSVPPPSNLELALPGLLGEIGYQFTSKLDSCRAQLMRMLGSPNKITASVVARIIGIMIRTHTGLDDSLTLQNMNATGTSIWEKDKNEPKTWNMEVFIKAIHELQSTLHWNEITLELDHPGFVVKDRQGLILLIEALNLGFKVQGLHRPFPVDSFYRIWKHTEGQVSLFQQILVNPDIFNFTDYVYHSVAVNLLKVQPDFSNIDTASWRSLELLDTLLSLAEHGHDQAVRDMFQFPKTHCPDVLTLGLIQINPPLTNFRTEILAQMLQVFFNHHQNSQVILSYAWGSDLKLKGLMVLSMADWYSKAQMDGDNEQARLSRVLDIAQDLKALTMLLNAKKVPFVIDLAVLASRREFLNLEKWINDQIREHGEAFIKASIQFLHRKLPSLSSSNHPAAGPLKEEQLVKANFSLESLVTILACLQNVMRQVTHLHSDLKDAIVSMLQMSQPLVANPRPNQQLPPPPTAPTSIMRPPHSHVDSGGGGGPAGSIGSPIRPTPRQGGFPMNPNDPLMNITSQFNNMHLPPSSVASSSSSFSLGSSSLGPLVSGGGAVGPGGSPSRIFGGGPSSMPPTSMESAAASGNANSPSPFSGMPPMPIASGSSSAQLAPGASSGGGGGGPPGGVMDRPGGINLFGEGVGGGPGGGANQIPREIEDEANSYFQRIYNHQLSIDEVLDLLKRFQESANHREKEVFQCMIKNLFEEYKFFPQYPEKELHITAQLFGGIIEHGLVTLVPLGLALRFVLDAIRKPTSSNMYYFGVAALDRFKMRLKDYPQYCQHITGIDHFKDFPPHLIEWVECGVQSNVPPDKPAGPVLPAHIEETIKLQSAGMATAPPTAAPTAAATTTAASPSSGAVGSGPSSSSSGPQGNKQPLPTSTVAPMTSTVASSSTIARPTVTTVGGRPSIANTTNIDTLLNARQKAVALAIPSEKIQDKVAFIFNNLSLMNMSQKSRELMEHLGEEYFGWLAQYLVMKRASIEPNFHSLYANFLETLHKEELYNCVLRETFGNIQILLGSDKAIANFSDRSLLKNLGHWLGLMTLHRNRPILMVDLDLKPLIIEAYHNGQQELLYVIPFVAKVLESCAKSRVFKPPCPWTMGIMNLLAELNQEHDLKLNLKFEIDVLCRTLTLKLANLNPGTLLKDYDKLNRMLNFNNFGMSQPPITSSGPPKSSMDNSFVQAHRKLDHPPMPQNMGMDMAPMMPSGGPFGPPSHSMLSQHQPGAAGAGLGRALIAGPTANLGMMGSSASAMNESVTSGVTASSAGSTGETLLPTSQSQATAHLSSNVTQSAAAAMAASMPVPSQNKPLEPKFHFMDIDTSSLNGIVSQITVDPRLTLLKEQPDFAQLVKLSIEKSIQEWASPVIDRAMKIALTTSEQLIKKDFALDHDEARMRSSAHSVVRNLMAGMAMITCRDHLNNSIKTHMKNFMASLGTNLTPQQQELIDATANQIAADNVELACAFIQKKAIEKALPEIDKRLKSEYDSRILAKKEGRRYCDPVALAYQNEQMPEAIRIKPGQVIPAQRAVYDEYARHIPGFKPLSEREAAAITPRTPSVAETPAGNVASSVAGPQTGPQAGAGGGPPRPMGANTPEQTPDECIGILEEVFNKIKGFVENCTHLPTNPHMTNLRGLLECMGRARQSKDPQNVVTLVQKAVENLLEGLIAQNEPTQIETEALARYRDANLLIFRAIADSRAFGQAWTNAKVTQFLIEAKEELRYNLDAVNSLIQFSFINLQEYDKYLAASMENGANVLATKFAMRICHVYLIEDRSNAQIIESDLFGTIEVLQKISSSSQMPPDGLSNLMEMIKMSSERLEQNLALSGPTGQLHSGIVQAKEFEDPPGLLEKTEFLLREWVNAYHSREAGKDSRQAFIVFVQLMNQHGILKTDDLITRFFRMSTQMCVDLCYRALGEQHNSPTLVRAKCFHTLDAYVRLITLLVKHSGETQNTITKVNLLNKVLGIVAGVLLIDHDVRNVEFQQVPYHRIFIMLFLELNSPDQILETINFQVLTAYYHMLHILSPSKAPGFAYAWLEIVSHRVFMGRMLASISQQKGWPMYSQLLVDLFKFLSPFLRNAELAKPVHRLYRGTLRVLLVLLHDFPEFLCDYHYGFCDVIPPNCIQMRNLILSAFPRNMRLPDPFTPNLKVEMLADIAIAPRAVTNYAGMIKPSFRKELDHYLKNRTPVSFLSDVRENLLVGNGDIPGNRYNIQLINALVMHVGTCAIQHIRAKGQTPNMSTIAHSSHMDIFQNLAVNLETEGRYLFLNCIANQLRYPNSHTHYFSCTLLYLFSEANTEAIQEQITRVLLERLIVNRPHPWGLLITFIELIKNPSFSFWQHEFVTCAPEIQKLFESVARSCMVPRMADGTNVSNNNSAD